jgi:DNA-directed RNA polymerase subunit RPC12/RpoP
MQANQGITRQFHADGKKRHSFLAMLFASGELRRYAQVSVMLRMRTQAVLNVRFMAWLIAYALVGYAIHQYLLPMFHNDYSGIFAVLWMCLLIPVAAILTSALDRVKCPNCNSRIAVGVDNYDELILPNKCPSCGHEL